MTQPLCFVTSNPHKLAEATRILAQPITSAPLELVEIQTESLDELVQHKTEQAFALLQQPVMVEDTSLGFAAWGGLPGPFIKYFLGQMGNQGLVQALAPFGQMAATARCVVGLKRSANAPVEVVEGQVEGQIVPPRGEQGFGWDALFVPNRQELTFAQMDPAQKDRYSMRRLALEALHQLL